MRWLLPLVLAAAGPLAAQQGTCGYSANRGPLFFPGASPPPLAGSVAVTVTASTGTTCSWSVDTTAWWIHVSPVSITGTGSVPFTLEPNTNAILRAGVITITGDRQPNPLTLTIYQTAGTCAYTLSPTSASIPVGGSSSGVLQVTTGCSWTMGSNQGWLKFTLDSGNVVSATDNPGATNYGDGKVDYTVAANPCVTPRGASLTAITGMSGVRPALAIVQDGSPDNLTLSPATLSTGSGATTGRVTVTTGSGCAWSAVSDVSWLGIAGASSGSGLSSFAYSIQANTGAARTGIIEVGPQTFTVTQQAAPVPLPQVTVVDNGASYASGAVSPGDIVALFGTNMGPAKGVAFQWSADGKSIPSTLAGVTVLFDSTPVALLYVSATQINAIVPYGVAGNPSTAVTVQYLGQGSNATTVPVQAATPGLFSADRTGSGPGAILNQDYSLNASTSPATALSWIMIFMTGGGVTYPAQTDGALAPVTEPLPRLVAQPTVTIGGLPATVAYAGAAPGAIAGLTQINAQIPAGVKAGLSVPVVVQIGNWQSQAALTITVK